MRPRTLTGVWGVFVFGLATIAVHPRVPPMSEIEAITPKTLGPVDGEGFECNGDFSTVENPATLYVADSRHTSCQVPGICDSS